MSTAATIDIEKILRNKLGKKYRFIPGFLVRALKNLLHVDWLNAFILQEGDKKGVEWLEDCVRYIETDVKVRGLENLPLVATGERYTFVSNHPLGGADGVILGAILGKYYAGKIRYLANDFLMYLEGLAPLIVPINVLGGQHRDTPRLVEEAFQGENHLIVFPSKICSRKINGVVQDVEWNKAFVSKSIAYQRDIVPIHFEGCNSNRFYRIANWSKRLGLKFNIAMLFLPDELYKQRGKSFTVTIGKPISYRALTREKTPKQWAAFVRNLVYEIGK